MFANISGFGEMYRKGDIDPGVRQYQQNLRLLGYIISIDEYDNASFGPYTEAATKKVQQKKGWKQTGIAEDRVVETVQNDVNFMFGKKLVKEEPKAALEKPVSTVLTTPKKYLTSEEYLRQIDTKLAAYDIKESFDIKKYLTTTNIAIGVLGAGLLMYLMTRKSSSVVVA